MTDVELVEDRNRIPHFMSSVRRGMARGLDELGDETLAQIDRGFARGVDAMGNEWEELSPQTVALKGHAKKLIETGDMRNSFESDVDPINAELEVTARDEKIGIHEFGVPSENIPRRPVLMPATRWVEHKGLDLHFKEPFVDEATEPLL